MDQFVTNDDLLHCLGENVSATIEVYQNPLHLPASCPFTVANYDQHARSRARSSSLLCASQASYSRRASRLFFIGAWQPTPSITCQKVIMARMMTKT